MFRITDNKGFQIVFENGCTLSVQFGPGNYTDSDIRNKDVAAPRNSHHWEAQTAEIAILLPNGGFYEIGDFDAVVGWQTAEDVAKWVEVARNIETGITK
jgi:hypothetical protein